jgi:pimeloyl-ACP methyl ester carboxylesterase
MFAGPSEEPAAAAAQTAGESVPPQPTLYLHGTTDGAIGVEVIGTVTDHVGPGSELVVVEGAGHFIHLEQPELVNGHILRFLAD